jgi:hypothetical protein
VTSPEPGTRRLWGGAVSVEAQFAVLLAGIVAMLAAERYRRIET